MFYHIKDVFHDRNISLIEYILMMTEYSFWEVFFFRKTPVFISLLDNYICTVFAISLFCRWQRETQIRSVAGRLQGEVAYFAPCGKKLRQYPDVMKVNS